MPKVAPGIWFTESRELAHVHHVGRVAAGKCAGRPRMWNPDTGALIKVSGVQEDDHRLNLAERVPLIGDKRP